MIMKNANALGNAGGHKTIVEEVDISTLGATKDWKIPEDITGFALVSIQGEWSGLTGTLDGTVDMIQSNAGTSWDTSGAQLTMSVAADSDVLQSSNFGSRFIGARFTKVGLTGGTLTLTLVVKSK